MAKNREYTGLLQTPPSMAWLIRERARLQGIIDRCDRVIDEHARRKVAAAQQLASMDAVFPLHEIKVEPTIIDGVRPHKPRRFRPDPIGHGNVYLGMHRNRDVHRVRLD